MAGRPKLQIEKVSKVFTSGDGSFVALHDIDLIINENEFVSVVGPSGCGKSTLLEIVAGLQVATRGRVLLDGSEIKKAGPDRAVVFQHYALFPWRTVIANVAFPMEFTGMTRSERHRKAMEHLKLVHLERFARRHVWQLSGGMQQRVALARALACDPQVLLMDEPFSGADAITREVLQQQLLDLHRATRKTVLFITHSVDEAIHLSDRIVVMGTQPGRVMKQFFLGSNAGGSGQANGVASAARLREEIWKLLSEEIRTDTD